MGNYPKLWIFFLQGSKVIWAMGGRNGAANNLDFEYLNLVSFSSLTLKDLFFAHIF